MTSAPEPTEPRLHTLSLGSAGPRIAFLHGLFGQGRNWTQIAKAVIGADGTGARALLVDLPDHGRSPWSHEFSFESYADQVAATLRAAGGEDRWTVVGHSIGGKVAMVLALAHPDLVERLAVVDVAPKSYGDLSRFAGYISAMRALPLLEIGDRADAEERFADVDPDPGVRAFLLQNLRREGGSWRWQSNVALFAADAARGGDSAIADFPAAVLDHPPYDGPVLWLAGADSGYVRPGDAEQMRALFPSARLVSVKGVGHWVHSQAPEVTVEALRALLAKPAG
ncbi:alpha/beta fold hydrolase [uncultured Nocardioides sp.]|uniref:alpha/beta fold hydrolase n=1 Tax=uncultured Nocardioides sp. TaxID=198441 RepID=UPI0025EE5E73|nr:alpha/beta fold hydrolase [uncultured Nocardioides sp.]